MSAAAAASVAAAKIGQIAENDSLIPPQPIKKKDYIDSPNEIPAKKAATKRSTSPERSSYPRRNSGKAADYTEIKK